MARNTPAPGSEALGAVQMKPAGDAGHDAIAVSDYTTMLPQSPCPHCSLPGIHRISPGAPPHDQRSSCGRCGRDLRWLSRSRPVTQEGRP